MKEIFSKPFMLTDSTEEPRYVKYSYYTGFFKYTYDTKGDLTVIEYYKNYNESTKVHSNLAVRETRVYHRDTTTGIQYKIEVLIEWFDVVGDVQAEKSFNKPLDVERGYDENKRSREGLLTKGTLYVFNKLITSDSVNGDNQAKEFLGRISDHIGTYKRGNKQKLIDAINEDNSPEITTEIKETLETILNIEY